MIRLHPRSFSGAICAALCLTPAAFGQWSSTATSHLAIGDGVAAQDQPKFAPTADGGCYVSWFDSDPSGTPAFGFDVRLQRLDSAGRELWPHGGVLVADRGFSSTQDHDLAVDLFGDALLTFRDDRLGGVEITAAKVDQSGTLVWGASGVQLTAAAGFVTSPKIAGTDDGDVVVAWQQDANVRVARLDPAGVRRSANDIVFSPPTGTFSASDLAASDNGSVILALQHSTGGFTSPRHLRAQKIDAQGASLWTAAHVPVFDGGSLQIGNFPSFVSDGAGGAVFAWYSSSPALECRVQRIDAAGTELFPHNGVTVSTDASRARVSPSVTFDPTTQEAVVAYVEQNTGQSMSGVSAQRFDASGARLWSPTGLTVVPIGSAAKSDVVALRIGDGSDAVVAWAEEPAFAQEVLRAALLPRTAPASITPFDLSSSPATKFRVVGATSAFGTAMFAWRDETAGNPDILAQNVLPDGSLGGLASATIRNGTGVNPLAYSNIVLPALGATWTTEVAHGPTALVTATFMNVLPATGPVAPGFGEVLVDFAIPTIFQQTIPSSGTFDTHSLTIPIDPGVLGLAFATQALIATPTSFQLTNAIDIRVGL